MINKNPYFYLLISFRINAAQVPVNSQTEDDIVIWCYQLLMCYQFYIMIFCLVFRSFKNNSMYTLVSMIGNNMCDSPFSSFFSPLNKNRNRSEKVTTLTIQKSYTYNNSRSVESNPTCSYDISHDMLNAMQRELDSKILASYERIKERVTNQFSLVLISAGHLSAS